MTRSSNSKDGESQQPECDASPSSVPQSQSNSTCSSDGQAWAEEPSAPSASPDSVTARGRFAHWAGVYRQRGYWPRPITSGTKACHVREWQMPDSELPEATLASWLTSHANHGIGLLMGSPFPDGTMLGAFDIDRGEYVRVGRATLGDTPCGRVGKKGAVFFIRVRGPLSNFEFKVRGDDGRRYGKVAECLFIRKLCVIPPTIHPDIGQPYRWFGRPLHEVEFNELPIVELGDA